MHKLFGMLQMTGGVLSIEGDTGIRRLCLLLRLEKTSVRIGEVRQTGEGKEPFIFPIISTLS